MNPKYIVTDEYLKTLGLNLGDYALDETLIPAIKNVALNTIVNPRIFQLNDDLKSAKQLEEYLDTDDKERTKEEKLDAYYTAQYKAIYNLIFQAETNPLDQYLDNIIVFQLGLGKINGFQKGYYHKQN